LGRALKEADVVIDGLLGMGLERPVEGLLKEIVELVNQSDRPLVVAVDLPTGVQADTGEVLGAAIRSTITVTMAAPKRGLYLFPAAGYVGQVVVAEIGIPEALLDEVSVELLDVKRLRGLLPARPADAHKGTFGRVLVVAGSLHYAGAPYLAAMGAYRVGAGLVTLAPPRTIYTALAGRAVEATYLPLPEGERGAIGEEAATVLGPELGRYRAMVLGCGLGQAKCTVAFVHRLLSVRDRVQAGIGFLSHDQGVEKQEWELPPTVIDADALNALVGVSEWWKGLPRASFVLTPHVGEMARLLATLQEEILHAPVAIAQRAAKMWGQIVVLKGAHTVVSHPDGGAVVHAEANPVLATAGTGDVLAGAIAGFLAQGLAPFEAAQMGVYIHGRAGALLRQEIGLAGGVAGDLLERLPWAVRDLGGDA
jgi:NAD(P)H-hydrate epimerase